MHWYMEVLRQYAAFSGRSRRKEYWYFVLFNLLISIGLGLIAGVAGTVMGAEWLGFAIVLLYFLAVLVPAVAVTIRRLHDTGRSGWWILLGVVPVLGLIMLVFLFQGSETGQNRYGPNPKEVKVAYGTGVAMA
jgi:uncharacterized membrane protein YhaH (DUF805 family)